jgi:hypothetical protein
VSPFELPQKSPFELPPTANDFLLALFGAIPFLAAPGQLLSAYLVDRWADRRR